MADKPMILCVATYDRVDEAQTDFMNVMAVHKTGDLGHVAAAVLEKNPQGTLTVKRHDTTAKHLAWGGALAGGLVGVLYPPLGAVMLSGSFVGGMAVAGAADAATLAGAGGIIGHYWHNISKKDLREMTDVLESGQAALVVVAVEKQPTDIESAITKATRKVSAKIDQGDVEQAYQQAVQDMHKAA